MAKLLLHLALANSSASPASPLLCVSKDNRKGTMNSLIARRYLPVVLMIISFYMEVVNGSVTLVGRNPALSFEDAEALFGPEIAEARGMLHVARPLDACTELKNYLSNRSTSNFALVIRGGCSFPEKVRRAQAAGFNLAVVYNNKYSDRVLAMDGDGEGISIAAIFISRESGETLAELAGYTGVDIRITGNDDSVDHSTRVDAVNTFFGVLFALFAIGLLIFESPDVMMYLRCLLFPVELPSPELLTYVRPPNRMRRNLVKAMPCVVYNPVVDPNRTDTSCVICLEEFTRGEKLRLLPCNHRFHRQCIDSWLTKWRAFCPICKHDARKRRPTPPVSVSNPVFSRPSPPIMVTH